MRGGLTDSCSRLSTFGLQGALTRGGPYPHRSTPPKPGFYVKFSDLGGGIASSEYLAGVGAQPVHTRATAAWTRLSSGLWVSVPAGSLRSYYNEDGVYCGALFEGSSTNICKHNRDLTNGVWVTTGSPTVAKDGTGMDGVANSCSTITCGAAGDTVIQAIVGGAASRQSSAWIKRLVGTGTVEITTDNGATWVDITSTLSSFHFRLCAPPVQFIVNHTIGIRMNTVGDQIAVDMAGIHTNINAAGCIVTPIETAAVNVTRNADALGEYAAANISDTEGTICLEFSTLYQTNSNTRVLVNVASGTTIGAAQVHTALPAAMIGTGDGTASTNSANASIQNYEYPRRGSVSWSVASGVKWACYEGSLLTIGGVPSTSAFDGSMGVNAGVFVARGTNPFMGCIKELRIWKHQLDINVLSGIVNRGGR